MPKKIDDCVSKVKAQYMAKGKSEKDAESTAYAICVKSTGWHKTGKHTWGKSEPTKPTEPSKAKGISEGISYKIDNLLLENDKRFPNGLYVDAKFDPGALQKIWSLFKKVGFKNMLPIQKAHATIIYSRRAPSTTFKPTPINGSAEPSHFEILGGNRDNPYLLVLVLKSKELHRKHKEYMQDYHLRYDYKEYKPHITVVYDIQRLLPGIKLKNPKAKKSIENMFNLLIKDMPKQIRIMKEDFSELMRD